MTNSNVVEKLFDEQPHPPLSQRRLLPVATFFDHHAIMGLQSLFVVNKAGSLIFYRRFNEDGPQLTQNDHLHLASTFHG